MTYRFEDNHVIFVHPIYLPIENWISLSGTKTRSNNSDHNGVFTHFFAEPLKRVREEDSFYLHEANSITKLFNELQHIDSIILKGSIRSCILHLDSGSLILITICNLNIKELALENTFVSDSLKDEYKNFSRKADKLILEELNQIPFTKRIKPGIDLCLGKKSCHTIFCINDTSDFSTKIFEKLIFKNEITSENLKARFTQTLNTDDYIFCGWSHSIISSKNPNTIFSFLGTLYLVQSIWFQYRSVRERLSSSSDELFSRKNKSLKNSELFNQASLKYNIWQNWVDIKLTNTNPQTKEYIDYLWNLWLMESLEKGIDSSFKSIRDALNISHQIRSIKQEKRQNVILFVIGLFNLFGIFGSIGAYYRLYGLAGMDITNYSILQNSIHLGPTVIIVTSALLLTLYLSRR